MFKTFVLLATIWHCSNESTPSFNVYVLDYGLSGEDCISAMIEGINSEILGIDFSEAVFSCEFDNGETEF